VNIKPSPREWGRRGSEGLEGLVDWCWGSTRPEAKGLGGLFVPFEFLYRG